MVKADDIKRLARKLGADLIGIASVDRFKYAPKGFKPTDILPNAESTISIAIKIPNSAIKANKSAHRSRNILQQFVYMQYGYLDLNNILNDIAYKISRELESMGYETIHIPASFPFHIRDLRGVLSHRHAAVAAGLGEFGWNNLLITPQFGTKQRLITIITSAKLDPDPLYNGEPLCKYDECKVCINICPAKAISNREYIEVVIGDRKFRYAKLDKWRCRVFEGIAPPYFLNKEGEIELPEKITYKEFIELRRKFDRWIVTYGEYGPMCGRCLAECPV